MDDVDARRGRPEGVVRLVAPTASEVLAAACHARGLVGRPHLDEPTCRTVLERLDIDTYLHPVWWVEAATCCRDEVTSVVVDVDRLVGTLFDLGDDEDADACTCGRVTLGDVVGWIDDVTQRQRAVDLHVHAMRAAFDHYWAGDAAIAGDVRDLGEDVCALCLAEGAPHVAAVGAEAEALAAELGAVIASHTATLRLGADRYEA